MNLNYYQERKTDILGGSTNYKQYLSVSTKNRLTIEHYFIGTQLKREYPFSKPKEKTIRARIIRARIKAYSLTKNNDPSHNTLEMYLFSNDDHLENSNKREIVNSYRLLNLLESDMVLKNPIYKQFDCVISSAKVKKYNDLDIFDVF